MTEEKPTSHIVNAQSVSSSAAEPDVAKMAKTTADGSKPSVTTPVSAPASSETKETNDAAPASTSTGRSTITEGTDVAAPASASIFPNDSPAQSGTSMGEHCVTDRPLPSGQTSTGEITKIADTDAYISKPADYPQSPGKLLLLLSSGTGIKSINNQIQADHFSKEGGFLVVMPDMFRGDPAPNSATRGADETDDSILEQIKLRAVDTVQSFKIDMWLARQTPEKILPILQKFVTSVKEEFADAVANGGGIYVVGYCIGAKYALLLSSNLPDTEAHGQSENTEPGVVKKESNVKAVAIAHGTMISSSDFEKLSAPLTVVSVENDPLFPEEIQEAGIKHLQDRSIKYEVETYKGVQHGFAVIGEYDNSNAKDSQKQAFKQMIDWLKAY